MGPLRYLVFGAIAVVLASVVFVGINLLVSSNLDASTGFVERWLLRAMCTHFELDGTVRDRRGRPVAFAVVEVSYLDERLTTRSNTDGTFTVKAAEPVCERRPPANVALLVMADEFRPKTHSVPFTADKHDVTLDAREFIRP
jgi:hypothetical protein